MKLNKYILFFLSSILLLLGGCSVKYSLGNVAKVPEEAKTVTVITFENVTTQAPPILAQKITEDYKDLIIAQSRLELEPRNGDLEFSGKITTYSVGVAALSSGSDRPSENRLTIAVQLKYINHLNEEDNFETTISAFETFPATSNLIDVENQLIDNITEQLTQLMFDKTFGDW